MPTSQATMLILFINDRGNFLCHLGRYSIAWIFFACTTNKLGINEMRLLKRLLLAAPHPYLLQ